MGSKRAQRWSWRCCWITLLIISLVCVAKIPSADAQHKKTLILPYTKDYPPFFYSDETSKPKGVIIEFWKLWSEKTGIPVDFLEVRSWNEVIEKVKNGQADVIPGIFYTKERDEYLDYSQGYSEVKTSLFVNKSLNAQSLEDIAQSEIGVVKSDRTEHQLKLILPNPHLKVYDGFEELVKAAVDGEVNVFAMDYPAGQYYLQKYNAVKQYSPLQTIFVARFHAAVQQGNKELLLSIIEGIEKIKESEIKAIFDRWKPEPVVIPLWFLKYLLPGAIVALLLGFLFVHAILLRRKIRIRTAELQRAQAAQLAAIGQTTAMVAHDVRKPLSGIKAMLSVLPEKKDDPEFMGRMSADVEKSIKRTNAMLSDILEFSKDAKTLEQRDADPQSIITAALSEVLRNQADADVGIEYDLKHKDYLYVDSDRIVRVLTNIISNAVEAMRGKGRLWIRTEDFSPGHGSGTTMTIVVGNNGPIISQEAQEKIFEPFYSHDKKGGTGLGLAICKKIIELHGGKIAVSSNAGATEFAITLPAKWGDLKINEAELIRHSDELKLFRKEEATRTEYGDTANMAEFMRLHKEHGRPSYLLIVDDEPLFRETVHSMLNCITHVRNHVKVIEVDSAEMALKQLEERQFDYVITDIDMGAYKMSGYEFAAVVLEKYPDTHVLIHSNKRKAELDKGIREIKNDHFMGFLPKPMSQSELIQFLACKTFERADMPPEAHTVLIVNDEDFMRTALRFELKKTGTVQVIEAAGVSDALKMFKEHSVDVVLADINLGEDRDGYDILREVRAQNKTTKFYMMSGMPREDEWPRAQEMGADGYIQLPFESDELHDILS